MQIANRKIANCKLENLGGARPAESRQGGLHEAKLCMYGEIALLLTNSGHVLGAEVPGEALLVGDVVVEVVAPRLHWRHVELDQVPLRRRALLPLQNRKIAISNFRSS